MENKDETWHYVFMYVRLESIIYWAWILRSPFIHGNVVRIGFCSICWHLCLVGAQTRRPIYIASSQQGLRHILYSFHFTLAYGLVLCMH